MREAEGSQALWSVAGELGEPVRSYVARLIAIQDLLSELPVDDQYRSPLLPEIELDLVELWREFDRALPHRPAT